MSALSATFRRELRVAFSRRAQPVWFRIAKWSVIIAGVILFHNAPWFWRCMAGAAALGMAVHFLYRCKTRTWTRSWGGWNDLEAGRD